MKKFVELRLIQEKFSLQQLSGDEQSLRRLVHVPDLNRPGLELVGFLKYSDLKRLVILGHKELAFINTLDQGKQDEIFGYLLNEVTPAIIVTDLNSVPERLITMAHQKRFPIFHSTLSTRVLNVELTTFLGEILSETVELHGVLMSVYGRGILITGASGVGKSEVALELLHRNHLLVADDLVICHQSGSKLVGKSSEVLQGFLEIRGIGIINVTWMFGANAVLQSANIDLGIHLTKLHVDEEFERLEHDEHLFREILGRQVPFLNIPVKEGRMMSVLIESAVRNFILQEMGMDSAEDFQQRVLKKIAENRQEGTNG